MERYKVTLGTVLPKMGTLWADEWLPSILPGLESSMTRDYTALTDPQLIDALEQMQQEFTARYVVHGKINFVIAGASIFVDFYNEIMDPEDPTEAYEALQGFQSLSLAAGKAMLGLGRTVWEVHSLLNYLSSISRTDSLLNWKPLMKAGTS